MASKIEQLLEAALSKLDNIDSRLTAVESGATTTTQTGPTDEQKSDETVANTLTGILDRIAAHKCGARLQGADRWFNTVGRGKNQAPLFEKFAIGDEVAMALNEAGRVVKVTKVGGKPTTTKATQSNGKSNGHSKATPPAEGEITRVSADGKKCQIRGKFGWHPMPATETVRAQTGFTGRTAETLERAPKSDGCPVCGGSVHGKNKATVVDFECASQQFARMMGVDEYRATMKPAYDAWMAANTVKVFHHSKAGYRTLVKGIPQDAPEGEASASPASSNSANTGTTRVAPTVQTITPTFSRSAMNDDDLDAKLADATEKNLPKVTKLADMVDGKYTALVNRLGTTPGNVRYVSAALTGYDGNGFWLKASPQYPNIVTATTKLNENDRVEIHVMKDRKGTPWIVSLKVLGKAQSETGHTPGYQTSGRQKPAAPRRQGTDPAVRKARQRRRHAA